MKLRRAVRLTLTTLASVSASQGPGPLPDPLQAGWQGKPVCERLQETEQQRLLRCTFAPGTGHDRHFHRPHIGYALSGGKMRITEETGVRETVLATGSTFTSPGVSWHEALNIGDTTVQYLIVESKVQVPMPPPAALRGSPSPADWRT